MKKISTSDLIPFDLFASSHPIEVDVVYADARHTENMFGDVYRQGAVMSGHIDMVVMVLIAAQILHKNQGWILQIKDCLRPVEAQQKMMDTDIVRANRQWLEEPRFLSPRGLGGHPRGMAVDVCAKDKSGRSIDFGTAFDAFAHSPLAQHNPAHRQHPDLTGDVMRNRQILDGAMLDAARKTERDLTLLSTEWWDFRFPADYSSAFEAISDEDLPAWQRLCDDSSPAIIPEKEAARMRSAVFDRLDKIGNL